MMLSIGNRNQNMDGKRHCILVAASNPYTLPTPVYRPQTQHIDYSDDVETPSDYHLSDAEALAKSFAQCAITLSVICPRKLPKLEAIYHAGKRDPQVADPPERNNDKNPHFIVLISDNFMEARDALSRSRMLNLPSNQNPVKIEVTLVGPVPPVSGPPPLVSFPPGMSQPMQPVGTSAMHAGKPNYVKFWEGKLSGRPEGQLVQLARIEGFRKASEPDTTLSSNWPKTLEIEGFISEIDMRDMVLGKAEMIRFRTTDQHLHLRNIQKEKQAGVIRLPSQTLLVKFSDKPHILIGGLLPGVGNILCFAFAVSSFQNTFPATSTTPAADFRPDSAAERSADAETLTSYAAANPAQPMQESKTSAKVQR